MRVRPSNLNNALCQVYSYRFIQVLFSKLDMFKIVQGVRISRLRAVMNHIYKPPLHFFKIYLLTAFKDVHTKFNVLQIDINFQRTK